VFEVHRCSPTDLIKDMDIIGLFSLNSLHKHDLINIQYFCPREKEREEVNDLMTFK